MKYSLVRMVCQSCFLLPDPNYQLQNTSLNLVQVFDQLAFAAHQNHLCVQARMSGQSQLAPHL